MIFYGVSYDNNVRIKTVRRLANKVKDLHNGFAEAIIIIIIIIIIKAII